MHLFISDPDDPSGMPLFDSDGSLANILYETAIRLIPGEYPGIVTLNGKRGNAPDFTYLATVIVPFNPDIKVRIRGPE